MRSLLVLVAALTVLAPSVHAQALPAAARAVLGDWTTYDDNTGEARVVVRFTEAGGVVVGRIVRVLPTREHPRPTTTCDDCAARYRGRDVRSYDLVTGMRWNGSEFTGGRIIDPESGRTYRATMRLDGPDRLRLRGFVGVRALGRTQVWQRTR